MWREGRMKIWLMKQKDWELGCNTKRTSNPSTSISKWTTSKYCASLRNSKWRDETKRIMSKLWRARFINSRKKSDNSRMSYREISVLARTDLRSRRNTKKTMFWPRLTTNLQNSRETSKAAKVHRIWSISRGHHKMCTPRGNPIILQLTYWKLKTRQPNKWFKFKIYILGFVREMQHQNQQDQGQSQIWEWTRKTQAQMIHSLAQACLIDNR